MTATPTSGARLLKALMGLAIALSGLLFTGLLWWSYERAQQTRHWPKAEAVIILSQVISERPSPGSPQMSHRVEVRYNYEYQGSRYTGTRVKRVEGPSNNRDKMDEIVASYPPGKMVTCYINPEQPGFAILEHATKAGLYSIWFPLLFVVGGGGMIISALRKPKDAGKVIN